MSLQERDKRAYRVLDFLFQEYKSQFGVDLHEHVNDTPAMTALVWEAFSTVASFRNTERNYCRPNLIITLRGNRMPPMQLNSGTKIPRSIVYSDEDPITESCSEIGVLFWKYAFGELDYARANARVNYREYIESSEWKQRANDAKERAGWRCQVCNIHADEKTLDAHHRTYERLGDEDPMDITVLCRDCHKLFEEHRRN